MPKPVDGLWETVTSFENLVAAYHECRRGKRYTDAALKFSFAVEQKLFELQGALLNRVWTPGRPHEFMVRDPKPRLIQAPPFADRVVHHALVRVIDPLFERRFIGDSYACRKGKGVHASIDRLQSFLRARQRREAATWVLQADISKYFPSINHQRLLDIIGRTVADKGVLWLCSRIVGGYGYTEGVGIPVGALTSQLFANVYLDQLDHWIKDQNGVEHYLRYMDDFLILGDDKAELWRFYEALADFLATRLSLRLNRKTSVFPAARGVDFCGYRTWATHVLPRKRNVKKARRKFRQLAGQYERGIVTFEEIRPYVTSFAGYMKHCQSRRTVEAMLDEFVMRTTPQSRARCLDDR